MDLVACLTRLTSLADLPGLVALLGHPPVWEPVAPAALPVPLPEAAVVGRAGGFEWLGVSLPSDTCRRLSVALSTRGRLVGILGLEPAARRLTLAVTVDRPAAWVVSLDAPSAGDLARLARLRVATKQAGLRFALRAIEILEEENTGRRFFVAFRAGLDRMAISLTGHLSQTERRTLALVQLTRVLFLYFVQAKGWLDGRPDFLRQAIDDTLTRRRQLQRDLFGPLFFGTLNRPAAERGRARRFGRIPFLNGGLFEPHPVERGWRGQIPNEAWRDAFDSIFERFQFTVQEGAEPGRVAPDMLGRVFEELMAPEVRRSSGSFYTPAALVSRLVNGGLVTLVAGRLGVAMAVAERELEARPLDRRVLELLQEITILDPAVGSGAFLLGALERLTALQEGEAPSALLRRQILERSLFGVDQNPMAVRLAELRLWLAVIAAESTTEPERVAPLPNLDGVVRQGDSLLDPAWFLSAMRARPEREAGSLRQLRRAFVTATGPAKRQLLRTLRQAETRAFEECLAQAARRTEAEATELLQCARSPTLFGDRRGMDPALRLKLRRVRARLSEIRRLDRRLRREGSVPWFSYECHFGDVLARGGFDLIVGNPPWVRAEQVPPAIREKLAHRYRWWHGSGRGFAHQPDLAVAFVERSLELVARGGVAALLLPAKLTTAGYAARIRAELAERYSLATVADLRDDPAAVFEATTYPAAFVIRNAAPAPSQVVSLSLDPGPVASIPQIRLIGGGPWPLAAPQLLDATAELRGAHPLLGGRFPPQLGVKTGANALFLDPPAAIEPALIRAALRGRDVRPFRAQPRLRLFFPHDAQGGVFPRLPTHAAAFAQTHLAALRGRTDFRAGPPWTLFRVRPSLAAHRVVWPDISRRLSAVALTGPGAAGIIPLNTCYLVALPDRNTALALAAWLNSSWLRAAARAVADVASHGFARFNARVVAQLPLPHSVLDDRRLVALAERGQRGEAIQEELDDITAEHLALSASARSVLARAPGILADNRGGSADRNR